MKRYLTRWSAFSFSWGMIGSVTMLNIGVAFAAFFKDLLLAKYMGTSEEADALAIALFIPDAIGNNLFAGAIGVVCVPLFARAAATAKDDYQQIVAGALVRTQMAAAVLLLCIAVSMPWLLPLFGHASENLNTLVSPLLWVMLPTILLFPLLAISTAALQSVGKFQRTAAAPLLFNVVFLLFIWGSDAFDLSHGTGAIVIAWGITLGVAASVWYVREPLASSLRGLRKGAKRVPLARIMMPYLTILLCTQAVYFVERMLASRMGEGVVAGLTFAFRLAQFPVWTLIAAVTVVILPALAQDAALNRTGQQRATISKALQYGLLFTVPIAALFYLLRLPIVALLFQRGAFDERSLQLTAAFLEGFALSIPGQAIALIGLRYFLAIGRLKEPVMIALSACMLTIAADVVWIPFLGPAALGYGAALGASAQAAAYLILLTRVFRVLDRRWFYVQLWETAANLPAVILVWWMLSFAWIQQWLSQGWSRPLLLAGCGLTYLATYAVFYFSAMRWRGGRS